MGARTEFGHALRCLRQGAGLTQKRLAADLGYATDSIRHYEAGHRTPPLDLGPRLDRHFHLPAPVMAVLCEEANKDRTPFGDLKEYEQRATKIRIWDSRVIPGLLQTEAYARTLLRDEEKVRDRLDRQRILHGPNAPSLRVVIDESVLWRRMGTPEEFRKQLEHLIAPDAPWEILVLPFTAGRHDGVNGPVTLIELPDEPRVAFLDTPSGGTLVDTPAVIAAMVDLWEQVLSCALSVDLSVEMIEAVIAELSEV